MTEPTARIAANPRQFPAGPQDTRRALPRHFPYVVVFRVGEDAAQVIAVFHSRRDPIHWERRL